MTILPLFKSHYSIGKSILTLDADDKTETKIKETAPVSICSIARHFNLSPVVIVDDNLSGFIEAYKNFESLGKQFIFGLRLTVCADMTQKNEESLKTESKVLIFLKNSAGYPGLLKVYSKAATEGKYYQPRIDWKVLKAMWDPNLVLAIPFYDSFLFNNSFCGSMCVPDFPVNPHLCLESHGLPFDNLLTGLVDDFSKKNDLPILNSHTVYYYRNSDITAYQTFRCISNRSTLEKPELDHFSSAEFSFESYCKKEGLNFE